jgi:hypothetical protein
MTRNGPFERATSSNRWIGSLMQNPIARKAVFFCMFGQAFGLDPRGSTPANVSYEWPVGQGVPSFSSWPYSLICLLVAIYSGISASCGGRRRQEVNFGVITATVDVVWMFIVLDGTAPPSARWTYGFPFADFPCISLTAN